MKIKRFQLLEKLNDDVFEFVDTFMGNVDDTVIDWIIVVSKNYIKFKEYKNANKIQFIEEKKLNKVKEFIELEKQIEKLEKQVKNLNKKKDKLEFEANSEILYKFQEELIEKNFDDFYKLFINPDADAGYDDEWEIHPDIIRKYGEKYIEEKIELHKASKKYNL